MPFFTPRSVRSSATATWTTGARNAAILAVAALIATTMSAPATSSATPAAEVAADTVAEDALSATPVADRLLVTYAPAATPAERAEVLDEAGAEVVAGSPTSATVIVRADGDAVSLSALRDDPTVVSVEPDTLLMQTAVADDPATVTGSGGWSMAGERSVGGIPASPFGTNTAAGWDASITGSRDVYVAVLDTGVDLTHPDLAANIFTNPGEIADNGIDDDDNGKIDDTRGWNFNNNNNDVSAAGDSHATGVAGIIGAVGGNGIGVAGVNWNVGIIPVKFIADGTGSTGAAVLGIDYIIDLKKRHGLNIVAINNSYGGKSHSDALERAMVRAGEAGIAMVTAAGNDGTDNDAVPFYPSNYTCRSWPAYAFECNVAVAAHEPAGKLVAYSWWGSNYGARTVDLSAPGDAVMTTLPGGRYGPFAGTSSAAPHVTGAFALCASAAPTLTTATIRELVLQATTPLADATGKVASGGMLNVGRLAMTCRDKVTKASAVGQWEHVSTSPGEITVAGWARYRTGDPTLRVTVDGEQRAAVTTEITPMWPPSVAVPYPPFRVSAPATAGVHTVCVDAGDIALGCQALRVFATSDPALAVTSVATADGLWWEVSGWALDPDDANQPVNVELSVNGKLQDATVASAPRSSIEKDLPGWPSRVGFSTYVTTQGEPSGIAELCVNAANIGPGSTTSSCQPLYVTPRAEPLGALDVVSLTGPSAVRVAGWAFDPNVSDAPTDVRITVDGRPVTTTATATVRADVARAFPGYGSNNGFSVDLTLPSRTGTRQICATAVNKSQGADNTSLGCKTVVTRAGNPFGNFESVRSRPGRTISVSGWALDPDTVAPTAVHVYVDGYFVGTATTSAARPDVSRVFPLYGTSRGFTAAFTLRKTGTRQVCVFAINAGPGTANTLLGCRSIAVS